MCLEPLLSVLAVRAYLYRVLQRMAGNPPDHNILRLFTAEETKEALSAYAGENTPVLQNADQALNAVAKQLEDDEFLSCLSQEYTVRFIGPGKLDAPPWESVYMAKAPVLFQKNTLDVRQFYRNYGMLPKAYPHVADDHLGLELDFMALLAQKTHDALAEGRTDEAAELLTSQRNFLQEHLLKWLPEYAQKAGCVPDSGLYAFLANVIKEFVAEDYKAIGELLQAVTD